MSDEQFKDLSTKLGLIFAMTVAIFILLLAMAIKVIGQELPKHPKQQYEACHLMGANSFDVDPKGIVCGKECHVEVDGNPSFCSMFGSDDYDFIDDQPRLRPRAWPARVHAKAKP